MRQIKEDMEICEFDGVSNASVYVGFMDNLKKANLKWRIADEETCRALGMDVKILKLSEIVAQAYDGDLIYIFMIEPLGGRILQYGNYPDGKWWQVGTLDGYA